MRVAVLQLSSQGLSSTKLYNYIRVASREGVKLLLLGEYVLNPFFKELKGMSISMIEEQTAFQTKVLKELSSSYNITIVAPLIIVKKKKLYKTTVKISPNSTAYYYQQILMNYPHWNEEKYFSNEIAELKAPLVFKIDGFKFAIMSGFELHFDELFLKLLPKNIDCILVPSVSTFDSFKRWKALILSRSFTNNCYILRANRIGEYKESEDDVWRFYGDSVLASPNGEMLNHLGNREELMIVDMNHKDIINSKKLWGFKDMINKREKK